MKSINTFVLSFFLLFGALGIVSAASATPTNPLNTTTTPRPTRNMSLTPTRRPMQSVTRTPALTGRYNACQSIQNALKTRSENTARHAQTLMTKFDNIVKRVDEFYKSKNVPAGKTVSNYTQLMTQIETNKGKVNTALEKAKATLASLNCNNNPRNTMQQFRADMQGVVTALKAYKTSVRNLIVAVHRVTPNVSVTPSVTVSVSPTMTVTPTIGI